jgi:hypothetical protein
MLSSQEGIYLIRQADPTEPSCSPDSDSRSLVENKRAA